MAALATGFEKRALARGKRSKPPRLHDLVHDVARKQGS